MPADGDPQEEWTRVKSKSRYRKAPRPDRPAPASASPAETQSTKPAAEIAAEYHTFRDRWQASDACARLRALVAENAAQGQPIRKAVCLGIGTFDPEHGGWDAKRRTYVQLLGFLTMVEELSKLADGPVPCLLQEPRFSPGDKAFLHGLGHEVVETPAAFDAVDDHTLLFAVHMYRPIYERALEGALPAAFVGTGWDTWDDVGNLGEGEFACMREMHASHRHFKFPQDGSHTTFSSTCLYWLPRKHEDESKGTGDGETSVEKSEVTEESAAPAGADSLTEETSAAPPDAVEEAAAATPSK